MAILKRKVEPGKEIRLAYKSKCNTDDFFVTWGMACPGNEYGPVTAGIEPKYAKILQMRRLAPQRNLTIIGHADIPLSRFDTTYLLMVYGPSNMGQWPDGKFRPVFSFLGFH